MRGLNVEAKIGLWAGEQDRQQPLIVDVELDIAGDDFRLLADTVNYERVVEHARALASGGHIGLVETFAQRLATACLAERRVLRVRVRVEKPGALVPHAAAAGVEIIVTKD